MGVIADAIVAYAQPLLDQTDGSQEQVNKAFAIAQTCWNLALMPEELREESIGRMQPTLQMTDDEFQAFRNTIVVPMVARHHEMFPGFGQLKSMKRSLPFSVEKHDEEPVSPGRPPAPLRSEKARVGRNDPCPCGSGKKFKRCCAR